MKKNGSDKLRERASETGENTASKDKPSRKPLKPVAQVVPSPVRKRVLPPPLDIIIYDMKAVLR